MREAGRDASSRQSLANAVLAGVAGVWSRSSQPVMTHGWGGAGRTMLLMACRWVTAVRGMCVRLSHGGGGGDSCP